MFQEEVESGAARALWKAQEKVKRVTCKVLLEVPKESPESSIKNLLERSRKSNLNGVA